MSIETSTRNHEIMRSSVSIVYDAQANRISTGNRIVQAVKRANGLIGEGAETLSKEDKEKQEKEERKFISILMDEYNIISEKYDSNTFMNEKTFGRILNILPEGTIKYMNNLFVYHMMSVYKNQLLTEETLTKTIAQMVANHPIWDGFLKDVTGCGPLMAAVCIAYLDPYKARHASSFWRYAGLDVVYERYSDKKSFELNTEIDPLDPVGSLEGGSYDPTNTEYFTKHVRVEWDDDREVYEADVFDAEATDTEIRISTIGQKFTLPMKEADTVVKPSKKNGLEEPKIIPGGKIIDFDIVELPDPIPAPDGHYVGRAKRHTIEVEYTDKNGDVKKKKSITYNPTLKTKLVGVLADSFIKCPGSHYEQVYRNYRHRLDNMAAHIGKTAAHKHMMAKRYCIKMFLADLWAKWREIEGLPVTEPYAVAYLGKNPHGFNYDPDQVK